MQNSKFLLLLVGFAKRFEQPYRASILSFIFVMLVESQIICVQSWMLLLIWGDGGGGGGMEIGTIYHFNYSIIDK